MKEEEWKAKVAKYANLKNMIRVIGKCLPKLSKVLLFNT